MSRNYAMKLQRRSYAVKHVASGHEQRSAAPGCTKLDYFMSRTASVFSVPSQAGPRVARGELKDPLCHFHLLVGLDEEAAAEGTSPCLPTLHRATSGCSSGNIFLVDKWH